MGRPRANLSSAEFTGREVRPRAREGKRNQ